jgi:2-keto-4-pentenoate hydratase/2-oxohepta-3-ene-1,7-dioic acid hydratase in catechol pathway
MLVNDWTLRELAGVEWVKGLGVLQSKPAAAFSPLAVTPDELGEAWHGGRVHLRLDTRWNGRSVGRCDAGPEMAFDFGRLIAHLARTRNVSAGSIVGSGAVATRTARMAIRASPSSVPSRPSTMEPPGPHTCSSAMSCASRCWGQTASRSSARSSSASDR